ncbi:PepSY domain-containing protein [Metaclostridioides mangenotii]|uniref:Membrane protein YkoI n=1 Tax=Metaclostridioides mangenotii TaxID=1540 RepID=A0ABS4E8L0_9FIRM|nr:PepSY domain-containing protein [Clostridioides mangenotii]MBP1854279.1 putative membrane protein YkoI [Clostridioides mangenotii]
MKKISTLLIMLVFVSSLSACGMNTNKERAKSDKQSITSNVKDEVYENNQEADKVSKEDNLKDKKLKLSYTEAIEKFREKHKNTDIVELELDKNHNYYLYDVEAVDDENKYEFSIDAQTSKIIKDETEMLDEHEKNGVAREQKINFDEAIIPSKAMDIATKKQSGVVKEWSLKNKNGITYYEVKIIENKTEHKVKVDAKSSEVLEVKKD